MLFPRSVCDTCLYCSSALQQRHPFPRTRVAFPLPAVSQVNGGRDTRREGTPPLGGSSRTARTEAPGVNASPRFRIVIVKKKRARARTSSVHDAVDLGVGHARVAAASHAARLHVGGAVEQTGGPLVRHREGLIDVRRERGELMRSTPAIHPIVPTRRDDVRPYFPTRRFGENFFGRFERRGGVGRFGFDPCKRSNLGLINRQSSHKIKTLQMFKCQSCPAVFHPPSPARRRATRRQTSPSLSRSAPVLPSSCWRFFRFRSATETNPRKETAANAQTP